MKSNKPVTKNQIIMKPDSILVRKTDLKGIITFCNQDFLDISGYSNDELIGKNHNKVRHPDMPAVAFQDLWDTIQKGNPWTGFVKNRAKNGDYYWVNANVTPLKKDGEIIEYLSVRYPPTEEEIKQANTLYKQVNEGRVSLNKTNFSDKINIISKMKIWQKLSAIILSLLLPVIMLTSMLISEKNTTIDFAEQEIRGIEYIQLLKELQQKLMQHRSVTNRILTTEEAPDVLNQQLLQVESETAATIGDVHQNNQQFASYLDIESEWRSIETDWSNLKSENLSLMADESFSKHSQLIEKIILLTNSVSDQSNLTLDSSLDTFYLIDIMVTRLPSLLNKMAELRDFGTEIVYSGRATRSEKLRLRIIQVQMSALIKATTRSIETVINNNEQLQILIGSQVNEFKEATGSFVAIADTEVIAVTNFDYEPEKFFNNGTLALTSSYQLYDAIAPNLTLLLNSRISTVSSNKFTTVGLAMIIVMIGLFISITVVKKITAPINKILVAFNRIMDGQFRNELSTNDEDELATVMHGLASMQTKLAFDIQDAKSKANAALRIKNSLDNSTTNVMMADNAFNLIYINSALHQFMEQNADDFKSHFDDEFDHTELIGEKMDMFPQHLQQLAEESIEPYHSLIKIGSLDINITANQVINEQNEVIGYMAEWHDMTAQIAVQDEISNIIQLAKVGDLSSRIDEKGKDGFFLELASGINEFTAVVSTAMDDISQVMEHLSTGDLTNQLTTDYQGVFGDVKNSINRTMTNLASTVTKISDSTKEMEVSSNEIVSGNIDLSKRTEKQASSIEETAASMEELTSTVQNNSENAQQANNLSLSAREVAQKGGEIVQETVDAMDEINQSSKEIFEIIGVIDEIAFQTNLLALNASVEAARAGEQGRGFAVVASEVRNLAGRSAKAAEEIKTLIMNSEKKVSTGTNLVNQAGDQLEEIVGSVKQLGDIISEISNSSKEQADGIGQINTAITLLDETTQQNAALAEETSAAAVTLSEKISDVLEKLNIFKLK